jgi:hypothetical protein
MMLRTTLTLALAAVLGACASAPAPQQMAASGAKPRTEQVCQKEQPTGMRIPITVCRTVEVIEERSDSDREWAGRIPTVVPDVR